MERLEQKLKLLIKALSVLERSIKRFKQTLSDDFENYEDRRTVVIKNFELSYDLFWKTLKELLKKPYGIAETGGPRDVFRKCVETNIISENEFVLCQAFIEDRNNSTHTYNEEIAEEIVKSVAQHYQLMKTVLDRIQKEIGQQPLP